MRVLIDHVTRMKGTNICVAGYDDAGGRYVRPLPIEGDRLTVKDLVSQGGCFDLGALVELGGVQARPRRPEIEDCRFPTGAARVIEHAEPAAFWEALTARAQTRLADIFGDELADDGRTCSLPPGHGVRSLGCFKPKWIDLRTERYDGELKVRVDLADPDHIGRVVALTDLRFFRDGVLRESTVKRLGRKLRDQQVLLSVGLSRAHAMGDRSERHWLQVNNIHLADEPLWDVPTRG